MTDQHPYAVENPHADLTPTMAKAMAMAIDHGGELIRQDGGYWTWRGGIKLVDYHAESVTIRALVARGALEYTEWQQRKVTHRGEGPTFPIAVRVRMEWIGPKS